jgi:N-acetylglucosamine-6-phosphate deacetylase
LITLAPELPGVLGAGGFIDQCVALNIRVGLGHHDADHATIREAVRHGAILSTHLGNGFKAINRKFHSVIDDQLAEDDLHASFIGDGYHVPFEALKNLLRAKQQRRSVLITDATAAAEMPPGQYKLGRQDITRLANGRVVLPNGGKLAGSSLTLDRAVINVVCRCGMRFQDAWQMASANPGRLFGIRGEQVTVDVRQSGFSIVTSGGGRPVPPSNPIAPCRTAHDEGTLGRPTREGAESARVGA